MANLKQVKLGDDIYEISAKYLHDASGNEKTLEEILALHNLEIRVVDELPTASASTMNALYLVPQSKTGDKNLKDEFITIDNGASATTRYTWEKIGSTEVDLSNYVTFDDETSSAKTGITISAHSASVTSQGTGSGSLLYGETSIANSWTTTGTVPGYKANTQKLSASAQAPAVTPTAKSAITGVGANGTAACYTSDTPTKKYLSKGSVRGVSGSTTASKVSNAGNVTNGQAANWGASVDANGVLSFSWTANTPTAVTLPSYSSVTVPVADTNDTAIVKGLADTGTLGEEILTDISFGTTNALTGVKATGSIDALTAVSVGAPSVSVSLGTTGDVDVATGISTNGTNAITASTVAGSSTKTVIGSVGSGSKSTNISTTNSGIAISVDNHTITDNGHKHGFTKA